MSQWVTKKMENTNNQEPDDVRIINIDAIQEERRVNPKAPWKHHRKLSDEKTTEFMTIEDAYKIINKIQNIRDKALACMLYLCAARVEEVVRFIPVKYGKTPARVIRNGKVRKVNYIDTTKKKVFPMQRSIQKDDIKIRQEDGKKIVVFKLRNLKTKNKNKRTKLIPLPLDKEINVLFFKPIEMYLETLNEEEELFPIGIRRAEQIINNIGFNPHFFRKLRLTHLVKYYNFSDQKLVAFAGWTDSRPAKHYIGISWKDLVNSM